MTTDRPTLRNRPADQPTTHRRRDNGASLVEVLIVLVIILIGVFAVIRIFPIGFTTLKRSESRLRADRLARTMTETLNTDTSTLPESITFSYYDTGVLRTVTDIDPDNLAPVSTAAADKLYFSDVNKFRYVKNEPVRVPLASAIGGQGFGSGVGSVHFLTFGPIFMDANVGNPANVPTAAQLPLYDSYLKVTSEKLIGTVVQSVDPSAETRYEPSRFQGTLRGVNTYVIDYGDEEDRASADAERPAILFAPSDVDRTFAITFTYEDSSVIPAVVRQGTCKIDVNAGDFQFKLLFDDDANDDGTNTDPDLLTRKVITSGTEIVTRNFTRLSSGTAWSATDPYQYKLVSANVATNANLGVIAFNPAGANFSVTVPGGTKPFSALVSYAVLDWHILRDDREVPASGKVRTTLPSIRVRKDEFVDLNETGANRNQVYGGLYPTAIYTDPAAIPSELESPDIQVFNLSDDTGTARLLVAGDLANKATTDANADYWISRSGRGGTYPSGQIYINTNKVAVGSKVRILYKASGDWAVAFQKAAKVYRNEEASERPVNNKAETFAIDRNGTSDPKDDRLYFHLSETNKSVTVAAEVTDSSGARRRLPPRQFSIANVEKPYSYALATDVFPELLSGVTNWRVVGDINGSSLKTRVIWQDEQNGRNPWRVADQETFVTRQAQ